MISELGFVYFFGSTAEKNVVKVCKRLAISPLQKLYAADL